MTLWGENGHVIKGLAVRLATSPDTGAVARSLLGLLAMAAVALYLGSPSAAMLAAGAGAIAGASALQETPNQRVSLVVAVSLELGAAVFVGSLAAAYSIVFVGVVAVWCFAAGMLWAVGSHAGLVAAAASALLIAVPPATPSPSTVLTLTALTTAAGLAQAALVAVWPPHRWRVDMATRGVQGRSGRTAPPGLPQRLPPAGTDQLDTARTAWHGRPGRTRRRRVEDPDRWGRDS